MILLACLPMPVEQRRRAVPTGPPGASQPSPHTQPQQHPLIPPRFISHPRNTYARAAKPADFTAGNPTNPCFPALLHACALPAPSPWACCPTDRARSHGGAPTLLAQPTLHTRDTLQPPLPMFHFWWLKKIAEHIPPKTVSISPQQLRATVCHRRTCLIFFIFFASDRRFFINCKYYMTQPCLMMHLAFIKVWFET